MDRHRRLVLVSSGGVAPSPTPVQGRLRCEGRLLMNDAGIYRAVWTDALSILSHAVADQDAYLDWVSRQGFGGVRIFAGALTWANQTADSACLALPHVMDACVQRDLYVEVTAITDSGTGYDVEQHLKDINSILLPYENTLVEIANEPYHSSQNEAVHDPDYLLHCTSFISENIMCALGAAPDDESLEYAGGDYMTVHLDRGRDDWNMVRRVRELENDSANSGKHVFNNEPKKAGSQLTDPAIVFCMAVLNRGFEVGGVFHSDSGLDAVVPDASQQAFADAYIAGASVITTAQKLSFQNAGWSSSPVKSANFDDGVGGGTGIVRAYSFMSDEQSVLVEVGAGSNPGIVMQNGWSVGPVLAERTAADGRKCRVDLLVKG